MAEPIRTMYIVDHEGYVHSIPGAVFDGDEKLIAAARALGVDIAAVKELLELQAAERRDARLRQQRLN